MQMNAKIYIAKGINVSCRTIDDETFVFREDTRELIHLNDVGSIIWDQINGLKTVGEIAEFCCQNFTGNREEIRACANEFLDSLLGRGVAVSSNKQFKGVMASAC
jgi:hypothetical protein